MSETRRGLAVKEKVTLNRVRRAMAKGMRTSVETLALSQLSRELDLTLLQSMRREKANGKSGVSLNVLLMAAVARTLPDHPFLNAELVDDQIVVYQPVNLGMAVTTPSGLIVTVIHNADQLTLEDMVRCIELLAERARQGKIELTDIEGGTFTVSNLGMFGVDSGLALPRPPESAVLLLGAVRPRPVALNGQVQIGQTCWASLTYDHRFIDGALVAAFFDGLSNLVGDPQRLFV